MPDEIAKEENPLGTKPLGGLLFSLAVPAIIANVVNSLYNIVDQIFIWASTLSSSSSLIFWCKSP